MVGSWAVNNNYSWVDDRPILKNWLINDMYFGWRRDKNMGGRWWIDRWDVFNGYLDVVFLAEKQLKIDALGIEKTGKYAIIDGIDYVRLGYSLDENNEIIEP